MPVDVTVQLNSQQYQLVERIRKLDRSAPKDDGQLIIEVVRRYLDERCEPSRLPTARKEKRTFLYGLIERRPVAEHSISPATGKAFPVNRGQVLRIEQMGDGQCLDFNAYNFIDYKDCFSAGRTRYFHGINPAVGDRLWSAPPREREMFTIVSDTVGTNDVMFPRCSALLYEVTWGFEYHTNCHDIFSEAIREYGLTPDDVHDSFNGFMNTKVTQDGQMTIGRMKARRGDYIELLAHFDILAVVIACGSDFATSNYELKGLKAVIYEGEPSDSEYLKTRPVFKNQRTVEDFKIKTIKTDRALTQNPSYTQEYRSVPLGENPVAVQLDDKVMFAIDDLLKTGEYGLGYAEALRFLFHEGFVRFYRDRR